MHSTRKFGIDSIDELSVEINLMETQIEQVFGPHSDLPKIILVGNTGAGKSSLLNSLANQSLSVIEGRGKKYMLNGNGVMAGGISVTKQPTLLLDPHNRFILCDCPGFEDTGGTNQEIINAFIIDYLFNSDPKVQNKFKVLLVASASELDASRGQIISNSVERLYKMIIDRGQLEKSFGLVITKGSIDMVNKDHIDCLKENPHPDSERWINHFSKNLDRVFVMPAPRREDVGKNYQFDDKERLTNFLLSDYMINPRHRIILSEAAASQINNLQLKYENYIQKIIEDMFGLIIIKYQEEQTSESLQKWQDVMNRMASQKIDNSKDLRSFISKNIPNNGEFEECLKNIENYEKFDTFIKNALEGEGISIFIQESIERCLKEINIQLAIFLKNTKNIETKQGQIDIQLQTIEECKKEAEKYKKLLKKTNSQIQKEKESTQMLTNQIKDLKEEIQQKQRDMELMIQRSQNDGGWDKKIAGLICTMKAFDSLSSMFNRFSNAPPSITPTSNPTPSITTETTTTPSSTSKPETKK